MDQYRVHTRIGGNHFKKGPRRRVTVKYAFDVFSQMIKHEFPCNILLQAFVW
jgi:hypothetical protein